MKTVQAPRASTILYNLLVSRKDVKPWLIPANICPIVPITFMKARVPFVLVDISAGTLHMDLDQAWALVRGREYGGVLYAHTYGEESTPEEFFESVRSIDPGLILVDDRCLCIPAFDGVSIADVVLFSTGYAKIVDLGFGGYAWMSEQIHYQPARLPFDPAAHANLEGEMKAAIRNQTRFEYIDTDWLQTGADLPDWDSYRMRIESELKASLAHRRQLNEIYTACLPMHIQLPQQYQTWRFNLRVSDKQRLLSTIFDAGLFASSHYASLAGIMSGDQAPSAEQLAGEIINLFNDHHFDHEKAGALCTIIRNSIHSEMK